MRNDDPQCTMDGTSAQSSARLAGGDPIKALLFDFDGTLTTPGALDFPSIKSALGCPLDTPILEYIQSLEDQRSQTEAMERLAGFEIEAAQRSTPNIGALETIAWLKRRNLALGIITRNSRASVLSALEGFHPLGARDFNMIITREDPVAPKPSGEGILWAARRFHLTPRQVLMVGDYLFDCQAGKDAGAVTILLDSGNDPRLRDAECDYRIGRLVEIKTILEQLGNG